MFNCTVVFMDGTSRGFTTNSHDEAIREAAKVGDFHKLFVCDPDSKEVPAWALQEYRARQVRDIAIFI